LPSQNLHTEYTSPIGKVKFITVSEKGIALYETCALWVCNGPKAMNLGFAARRAEGISEPETDGRKRRGASSVMEGREG